MNEQTGKIYRIKAKLTGDQYLIFLKKYGLKDKNSISPVMIVGSPSEYEAFLIFDEEVKEKFCEYLKNVNYPYKVDWEISHTM